MTNATQIEKMHLETKDLVSDRIEQPKALFLENEAEGNGAIGFEQLCLILRSYVDESRERYAFT